MLYTGWITNVLCFFKNNIICIRGETAQSLFGSFMLYIYIYITFYTVFLKDFYWQNILLQSFSLFWISWGGWQCCHLCCKQHSQQTYRAFIPLTGKISVIANLIWCKNRLCSLCCTETHWQQKALKNLVGQDICKWIGLELGCERGLSVKLLYHLNHFSDWLLLYETF